MEEHIVRLEYKNKEIILIKTAHVSKQSAALVKEVIDTELPDSVCIELDEGRYESITNPNSWEKTDIIRVIKDKKVGFLLANLILSSYQKKLAKQLNTNVGQEMIQGIESANEHNARLVMADRSIQTTFLRVWRSLGLWDKLKLLYSLTSSMTEEEEITEEDLQNLLNEDMLEKAIFGIKNTFPKVGKVLLEERDQYLAYKIKRAPGKKIVAVLGGAHVPGVSKEIYNDYDINEISTVPPKKLTSKILTWILPTLITALLVYSFVLNFQTGVRQLGVWILWSGSLAALFTALALGHPLSILTAFVTAPVSALHPLLACGWFAGLVEASIRKPTVKDIQNVSTDITSIKSAFKNRFIKALIVVIMANLGTTIGVFIAGIDLFKNIF
jgi:pheromone shutdown-related protein TraB